MDFFGADNEEVKEDELGSIMIKDLDKGISYDSREESKVAEINSKFDLLIPETVEDPMKPQTKAWQDYWRKIRRLKEEFFDCVQMGDLQGVKQILEQPNMPFNAEIRWHDEWTPLHYATNEGHAEVVEYLIQKGADVKAKTSFDYSTLHLGSIRGSLKCIELILQKDKSFINDIDKDFNTPLHYACKYGFQKIVELLLDDNASITAVNGVGNMPAEEIQNFDVLQTVFRKIHEKGIDAEKAFPSNSYNSRTVFGQSIMKNSRQDHVNKLLRLTKSIDLSSITSKSQQKDSPEDKQEQKLNSSGNSTQKLSKNPLLFKQIEVASSEDFHVGPSDFSVVETLGKGAFGQVYLVQKKDDANQYAMKVLQKERILGKKILKYAITERNVLSVMHHPFIVSLKYAFQTKNKLYLVMDYCPGGDLDHLLFRKGRLPESIAKIYICEIVLALEALHSKNIMFRDLKPSNVVLDKDGHACITDFGLAKQGVQRGDITKSFCGSLAYLPPEMLNKTGHTQSLDWYLLGVLFYELLEGMPPYYSDSKQKLFENIRTASLKMPKNASENARSLLKQLLNKDPVLRLGSKGSEDVKNHVFFKDVNWEDVYNKKLVPPVPKKSPGQAIIETKQMDKLKVTVSLEEQRPIEGVESNYVDSWDFSMKNKQSLA